MIKWFKILLVINYLFLVNFCSTYYCNSIETKQETKKAVNREVLNDKLIHIGAKQISVEKDEIVCEISEGIRMNLVFDKEELAAIFVYLTEEYEEENVTFKTSRERCCMSIVTYKNMVDRLDQIKSLGEFIKKNPISAIPTSGWIRRAEEYSNAVIVRSEMNCEKPIVDIGCGIDRFTVFYWIPLEGKIDKKQIEKCEILGPPLIEKFYIVISGEKIEVLKSDYLILQIGQFVKIKRNIGGGVAKLISIN